MKKAQFQISIFHLLAIVLSIILVIYVGITQNKITMETVTSNTEAQHLRVVRRLFTSPDCLAYESREYGVINTTGVVNVLSARKINSFVIDMNKFYNWENINCLRNIIGSHLIEQISSPTQVRVYYTEITNLETRELHVGGSTFPRNRLSYTSFLWEYTDITYLGKGLCEDSGNYFHDIFPVLLYDNNRFYNGLVYIESCLIGGVITREEISYGKV